MSIFFFHGSVVYGEAGFNNISGIVGTGMTGLLKSPRTLKFCKSEGMNVAFCNLLKKMSGKKFGFHQKDEGSIMGSST